MKSIPCEKIAYPTSAAANKASKRIARSLGGHRKQRAYICGFCNNWHLTKQKKPY